MLNFNIFFVIVIFLIIDRVVTQLSTGSGSFQVISANNKPIDVATFVPVGVTKSSSIVMAMHGLGDDGTGMRDAWISLANQYNYIILAPNFNANWTGNYQLAGLDGPRADWQIDVLDRVFDEAKKLYDSSQQSYYFYGMSAGCQFVHRTSTFTFSTKINSDAVVCASAGYYTLPVFNQTFPYGLKSAPTLPNVLPHFSRNTYMIVGGADTIRDSAFLQTPEADQQGLTRLARAHNYFNVCKAAAAQVIFPFNWRFDVLPGVGHDNGPLASFAAAKFNKWD